MKSLALFLKASMISLSLLLMAAGCATQPKHSFSMDTTPEVEERGVAAELESLREQQFDVFSPTHFRAAEKALLKARAGIKDQDERVAILNQLQIAKNAMYNARTHGALWKREFGAVAKAREKLVSTGIPSQEFADFSRTDNELMDITEERFVAGKHVDEAANLQKRYMDLEVRSIQTLQLGQARAMIETAKEEKASKFAAHTLKKAEMDLLEAEQQVEAFRYQPEGYRDAVTRANDSARELLAITLASRDAKGKSPEEIAIAARAKERERSQQIAAGDMQSARAIARGLQREQEQAARIREIEKIKEIENRFSKDEAEVYRQGDSVVVRLKAIRFPSAKSELPDASKATLAKVKAVLEDIPARRVVIEGHTDSVGGRSVNQSISEKRAVSVSKYLTAEGPIAPTVEAVGYGYDRPLASNKTKEGRATNRRVDVVITPSTQAE